MAKKRKTQIAKFIKEIEATAKRLRADVQKRVMAAGLDKKLHQAAAQLEKRAKTAASHVRKHAADLKKQLAKKKPTRRPARKARTRKKRKK